MRKACPWQRTGGVVDHQMVNVIVRDAGRGNGRRVGDLKCASEVEIFHLAEHRRPDTLAGTE